MFFRGPSSHILREQPETITHIPELMFINRLLSPPRLREEYLKQAKS